MIPAGRIRILTIKSGSSSRKIALYEINGRESLIFAAHAHRIGDAGGHISATDGGAGYRVTIRRSCRNLLRDKLVEHKRFICEHGDDLPEVRDWKWPY